MSEYADGKRGGHADLKVPKDAFHRCCVGIRSHAFAFAIGMLGGEKGTHARMDPSNCQPAALPW